MASPGQHRIRIFGISLLAAPAALPLRQAQRRRCLGTAAALAIGFVLVVIAAPTAEAQTYTVVYKLTPRRGRGQPRSRGTRCESSQESRLEIVNWG